MATLVRDPFVTAALSIDKQINIAVCPIRPSLLSKLLRRHKKEIDFDTLKEAMLLYNKAFDPFFIFLSEYCEESNFSFTTLLLDNNAWEYIPHEVCSNETAVVRLYFIISLLKKKRGETKTELFSTLDDFKVVRLENLFISLASTFMKRLITEDEAKELAEHVFSM